MLCPNGTVKPFLVSLVEPVAYLKSELNLVSATQFVDLTVQTGQTYTYVVTSVDASNVESSYSNPSTATID
jgi:hypothetical protein